jgi:putative SOS response-associated peptidase YedK
MCGRYTETRREKAYLQRLGIIPAKPEMPDLFVPRFNIAPTQLASVIIQADDGTRSIRQFKWGLIPSWATDEKIGARAINARGDTVAEKPMFRASFKNRRCLVLSDGFFEWQKLGNLKQPMYIRLRGGEPFVFGGLWDRWKSPSGAEIESFSILTVEPNELAAKIHDRMPLMLDTENALAWLDSKSTPEQLGGLLKPYSADAMEAFAVSPIVNSPKNIGPECVAPMVAPVREPVPIQASLF